MHCSFFCFMFFSPELWSMYGVSFSVRSFYYVLMSIRVLPLTPEQQRINFLTHSLPCVSVAAVIPSAFWNLKGLMQTPSLSFLGSRLPETIIVASMTSSCWICCSTNWSKSPLASFCRRKHQLLSLILGFTFRIFVLIFVLSLPSLHVARIWSSGFSTHRQSNHS